MTKKLNQYKLTFVKNNDLMNEEKWQKKIKNKQANKGKLCVVIYTSRFERIDNMCSVGYFYNFKYRIRELFTDLKLHILREWYSQCL